MSASFEPCTALNLATGLAKSYYALTNQTISVIKYKSFKALLRRGFLGVYNKINGLFCSIISMNNCKSKWL